MELEQLAAAIESIRIAPLRPDDVLIAKIPDVYLSDEQARRIRQELKAVFGVDRKVVVIGGGMDLEIARPSQ